MLDGSDDLMNKRNKGRIRVYSLIFLVLCIVFGKTYVYQVKEKNRLNNKIQTLQERKDKLNSEIGEAKENLQKVDSEEFIKKVAREKLKMVEKDEIVVKYKDND
ncbi:septum formation initiator family protein [Parvimonas micra]|uniref:FtsB family cell division protein n=2 Tax=Parvimonas TaxID=543311 RepID=UPI00114600D3|nr:septum formation initiator family protein [Parvimonas sp.]MBF1299787.1 septum formation initiator family protein [Parvimonas sp.]MEB3087213.1 septum formation initiator family protein [Parvimonas sp. D4]